MVVLIGSGRHAPLSPLHAAAAASEACVGVPRFLIPNELTVH